jgi:hypothetical protein
VYCIGIEAIRFKTNTLLQMKTLSFRCRGEVVTVSLESETLGHIIEGNGIKWLLPHDSWRIVGFSRHHMSRSFSPLTTETQPADVDGCLVWDRDHGTLRTWMGSYQNRLPRASNATISNV